jgi:hypothetical protein
VIGVRARPSEEADRRQAAGCDEDIDVRHEQEVPVALVVDLADEALAATAAVADPRARPRPLAVEHRLHDPHLALRVHRIRERPLPQHVLGAEGLFEAHRSGGG